MSRLDDVRSLCLEPNGDIPVCDFVLGNVRESNVSEILDAYDPYEDSSMRLILQEGVGGLAREARSLGLELRAGGYYSVCDMCRSLRRDIATMRR